MKLPLEDIKAVIFDMDGTMISNMRYHRNAWMEFTKQYGLEMSEEDFKKKFSGRKNQQIFEMLFGKSLTKEEVDKYTEEKESIYRKLYLPDIKEVEGLTNIIKKFQEKGLKLAIATNAPEKNRKFVLESLDFTNTFPIILGEEHIVHGKPHPEIYLETAKQLRINPKECLVFEDTPVGVEAGKNAGMTVVGILTRHTKEELNKADLVVDNFSQLELN